jgi:cytochrome c556
MKRIVWIIIAAGFLVCLAGLIFEMNQVADLRDQLAKLKQKNSAALAEMDKAVRDAKFDNDTLRDQNQRLKQAATDATKGSAVSDRGHGNTADIYKSPDPFLQMVDAYVQKASLLHQKLQAMPSAQIPELSLLTVEDWLKAGQEAKLDTDADVRQSLRKLRELAKDELPLGSGLFNYVSANNGNLPADMSQLAPYLRTPVDISILSRYSILYQGNVSKLPVGAWVIVETSPPVDPQWDNQAKFGVGTSTVMDIGSGNSGDTGQP